MGELRRCEAGRSPRGARPHHGSRRAARTAPRRSPDCRGNHPRRVSWSRMTSRTLDISFDREPEERGDPAKGLQLLARLVMAAHQDDGPSSGLRGPHQILDPGIPDDGVAHEEGLDRAGFDRFGNFGGTAWTRTAPPAGLPQPPDGPPLVT